jgi:hypothetical protein
MPDGSQLDREHFRGITTRSERIESVLCFAMRVDKSISMELTSEFKMALAESPKPIMIQFGTGNGDLLGCSSSSISNITCRD